MKTRFLSSMGMAAFAAMFMFQPAVFGASLTVLTVPWIPTNPTSPHSSYAVTTTTESTVVLGATAPSAVGSADTFKAVWAFGDGSANVTISPVTNPYDISTTHQYPASAAVGTTWTATVTVTDTTSGATGSAHYYVFQEANSTSTAAARLQARVNIAIDWGLWYMHQTEWRGTTTVNLKTVNWGGWDTAGGSPGCPAVNGNSWDCYNYGVIDAENVQAMEVNGHLESGPATDPYTDDVARGLARMFNFLATQAAGTDTYNYNPATANYTCKDGSTPTTGDALCASHGGQFFYNPSATSCTSPPCTFTFDANKNGLTTYDVQSGEPIYTTSPYLDAMVASAKPTALAAAGGVGIQGETFETIAQDIVDYYAYSQYGQDPDVSVNYNRGGNYSAQGGGWLYQPQEGDDNSTSQWAAIGLISANRAFGIAIPKITTDTNNVWITNSEDVTDTAPTGPDSYASGDDAGAFGYRGSWAFSTTSWGPFATSPSGMVQMALDGVGRTTNTKLGDSTTAFDQRWNNAETFYADNFCNSVTPYNQAGKAPRAYMYGMFSFTKSMLLHAPSGVLSPIQYLRTQTPNVFTTNPNVPKDSIDWYAALSAANGGDDPCDGIAQTLVSYQANPVNGTFDGHWYGNSTDQTSAQYPFETAWALIMLQKTVFGCSVKTVQGRGTPAGAAPARIDLTWTTTGGQANSYDVLRATANSGPFTQVGTSTTTVYSDRTGLSDGDSYFYVVQPVTGGVATCQSTPSAAITVPK